MTGGPTIDFVPGRKVWHIICSICQFLVFVLFNDFIFSSQDSKISPREGRLPDANQGLLTFFCLNILCIWVRAIVPFNGHFLFAPTLSLISVRCICLLICLQKKKKNIFMLIDSWRFVGAF